MFVYTEAFVAANPKWTILVRLPHPMLAAPIKRIRACTQALS